MKLSEPDFSLLERIADEEGLTFSEVWRRALHLFESERSRVPHTAEEARIAA